MNKIIRPVVLSIVLVVSACGGGGRSTGGGGKGGVGGGAAGSTGTGGVGGAAGTTGTGGGGAAGTAGNGAGGSAGNPDSGTDAGQMDVASSDAVDAPQDALSDASDGRTETADTSGSDAEAPADGGCVAAALTFPVAGCSNVASSGVASASAFATVNGILRTPANAVDGLLCTSWNAGDYPPQWWQIDLGQTRSIRGLTVVPDMFPATAAVVHDVQVSSDGTTFTTKLTISATMTNGVATSWDLGSNVSARYVRIQTVTSPSWVAWEDIAIYECP